MDGDNDQDVLISGYAGRDDDDNDIFTVTLYTNDGSGNFTEETGTPFTGVSSGSLAFADVDGDNDQDVLISGYAGRDDDDNDIFTVTLYTNDGSGNFTEETGTPFTGVSSGSLAFADVDGDNDQDVIISGNVGTFRSPEPIATLYTNDGSGNFTEETSGAPFTGVQFSSIAFADVDGDNDQDVIITGSTGSNRITTLYTNDGSGNFTRETGTPFTGVSNGSITFADVDGDNDQDVLITGYDGSNRIATLYSNNGSGNFTEETETPFTGVSNGSIAFADVDGDNDQDVFITRFDGSNNITKRYTNDGSGNFTEEEGTPFTGVSNGSITFADVDGDNDQDVLITGRDRNSNPTVRLYTNDGSGNFTRKRGTPFTGGSIAFADVDGDSDQDVFITRSDRFNRITTTLYTNDGSGNFTEEEGAPFTGVSNGSIAFADVDGDNDQDVLITGFSLSGRIAKLYTNDGSGNFTEETETPFTGVSMGSSIAFADVDGDNDQDVLITGWNGGFNEIARLYTNDGSGNFFQASPPKLVTPPLTGVYNSSIAFADVDGDNDQDVLITGYDGDNEIARLYTNDGSGNFTEETETPFTGVSNGSIAFADVDGDNDQDVLITGSNSARLYTNDGLGNFTQKTTGTPFTTGVSRSSIAFADVDGDNDQDVLITGWTGLKRIATLYTNDGSGNFTEETEIIFTGVDDSSIAFADVDGDNDQDVLITGEDSDNNRTATLYTNDGYTNDGSGDFTEETGTPFTGVSFGSSIAFADVDGDNDQDVLITGSRTARLYINDGSGSFTATETPFMRVGFSSIAFADVDGDNDQDVLITGSNSARLYTNDGSGNFTEETGTYFTGVYFSSIAFADVDGDDNADVLITGLNNPDNPVPTALLYINEKTPVFASGSSAAAEVPENTTAVQTVMATHAENLDLTYTIGGGVDSTLFNISTMGVLTFKTAPDFENPADRNSNNIYKIIVTVSDGENEVPQIITVTVTDVNDNAPVITSDAAINVAENTTATGLTVTATDADASAIIRYSITGGADRNLFNIDEGSGALTFKSPPDFEGSSTDGDDDYEVIVTASDGTNSDTQTITVAVTNVNEAPVITSDASIDVEENTAATGLTVMATDADAGTTIMYAISGGADGALLSINANSGVLTFINAPDFEGSSADGDDEYEVIVTASDGDNSIMQTITVTVTNVNEAPVINSDATKSVAENTTEVLTVTATDPDAGAVIRYAISGGTDRALFTIGETSGVLTFTTAPDFEGSSADGDDDYEVIITVSDRDNSVMQTLTISVTDVNDNTPVITSDASTNVAENTAATGLTVTATDADAGAVITYSVTGGADGALFTIEETSGALNFMTAPDFEGSSADGDDDYEVIITASDGDNSVIQTITVTVTDVNDNDPVITSDASISVAENTAATGLTVTATDADAGTTLMYSISGGADRALFTIGETSGVLTYITAPDFEGASADGDDDYEVIVTASDGDNSVTQTITVTVTDVNDNTPVIASDAAINVAENTAATGLTVTATDADASAVIRYAISGGADRGLFTIEETSGVLTFINAPDFEGASTDGDDDYEVIVTASDGENSVMQTITVTVTDVNEIPEITSLATATIAENTTDVLTVAATDPDVGAVIRYSTSGGADGTLFAIGETSGALTFMTAPDFEGSSADGDDDYEVIVTASDGENSVTQTITVTITDVNDNTPVITSDASINVAENTAATGLTVTSIDADAGAVIRYAISGGADRALFTIGETSGVLTFTTAPDFEGASADGDDVYEVIVTASDGDNSVMQTITVTVTDVNEVPEITSLATATIAENTTDVLTVAATDPDVGAVIRYSTSGGADGTLFAIGETSGALTFTTAPDFEGSSADGDDAYEVIITASDGENSVMQTITVTVTDMNDNTPVITSDAMASIAENTTDVLTVTATDTDTGTTFMYSISGGADRALFTIGETSGVLTFTTAPDFEGSSADGDDEYEVEITVSDGTNSATQTIIVMVTRDVLGLSEAEGVRLYPNPASSHFTLIGTSGRLSRVSLVSTSGKMVRAYPVSKDGVYDTSGLSEGIFFVIIEGTEGRQQAGRIVIRK